MSRLTPPASRPGAFTLIELLVAFTVFALLLVVLANMVDSSTRLWRESENRVDAYREARAALSLITTDLQSILVSPNTNYFSTNALGGLGSQPPEPGGLYFLSGLSADAQVTGNKGVLCAVGYYRRWARQNSGFLQTNAADPTKVGYQLFRSLRGSDQTYSNLVSTNVPLNDLADPDSVTTAKPEILARNICSLEFRFFQTNTPGNNVRFLPWTYSTNNPMPQMIEVRITAISDELAQRLGGQQARWTTNDALVAKSMRSFVSRVRITGVSTN